MTAVTITVTQADITAGAMGDCAQCPVARAVMRALQIRWISVGPDEMDLGQDSSLREVPAPEAARRFIARFDDGRPVAPFSFDLDVPDDLIPAGA